MTLLCLSLLLSRVCLAVVPPIPTSVKPAVNKIGCAGPAAKRGLIVTLLVDAAAIAGCGSTSTGSGNCSYAGADARLKYRSTDKWQQQYKADFAAWQSRLREFLEATKADYANATVESATPGTFVELQQSLHGFHAAMRLGKRR